MEIQTERLCLRPVKQSDAQDVLSAMKCPEIHQMHSFGFTDLEKVRGYIGVLEREYGAGKFRTLAAAQKGTDRLLGLMTIDVLEKFARAELSYWISQEHWNRGYGTESVKAAMRCGFQTLALNRIQALTSNPASERVLQKAGMIYEGTLRQYYGMNGSFWDCKMFSALREDFDGI